MESINVYTIHPSKGIFTLNKNICVARIPNIGEKIIITDSSYKTSVYEVIDVHFSDEGDIDLYTKNRGDHTDYTVDLSDEIEDNDE